MALAAGAGIAPWLRAAEESGLKPKLALGYDNFAVRAMGWKAEELIDHAVKLKVDSLFITDLFAFRSLEPGPLAEVRKRAEQAGVKLFLGTWSLCPSSPSFNDAWGSAEEHLATGVRVAQALGSPVLRVVLGSDKDRTTEGGIRARIADMVEFLKANRSVATDAGVKIAVENHAGDMHSLELRDLVEAAGSDYVGVNLDAGNAVWALETPLQNLENLGKHVLTTSLRDSSVWPSAKGVTVQWRAMGEGMVDWKTYFKRFAELCPEVSVNIETISGFNRELEVKEPGFWKAWPEGEPAGYEDFMKWAASGKPVAPWQAPDGGEDEKRKAEQDHQKGELERSLAYCRSLGLGRRS